VCIGFDSAHSFFQGCEDKIIRISSLQPVKYRTEPPLINKNKLDDVLFTKSVEWAFEEESRMIFTSKQPPLVADAESDTPVRWRVCCNAAVRERLKNRDQKRPVMHKLIQGVLVQLPLGAVREIIVGFEADSLLKDFLRKRSDEMGVPLKYAVPSHTSFRIEKVDTDPRP
jgi:hypothetical protein